MSAQLIDGKALAAEVKAEAAAETERLKAQGVDPCLAVILVGEDPASQVYVRGKVNDCKACGIESREYRLPADTTQTDLLALVAELSSILAFSAASRMRLMAVVSRVRSMCSCFWKHSTR